MAEQLQTPLPTPVGQQATQASPVTSPAATGGGPFKFGPRLLWVLVGLLLVLFMISALVVFKGVRKTVEEEPVEGELVIPEVSLPDPDVAPEPLPVVAEEEASPLQDYFARVSVNFRAEFMDQVSAAAADFFLKYEAAGDEAEKLEAGRAFYIYLDNPAVDKSDPAFVAFLADVKADLEKTLGKPLF